MGIFTSFSIEMNFLEGLITGHSIYNLIIAYQISLSVDLKLKNHLIKLIVGTFEMGRAYLGVFKDSGTTARFLEI
jgi:hypothetical protein